LLPFLLPLLSLLLLLLLLGLRDGLTGNAPDYAEAMRWHLKAAEEKGANNALAQNNIGRAYQAGEGVPKDAAAPARWYRKAADQGYGVAEFNLAVMLRNGAPGVPQDHAAALELAHRAEQHGVAEAAGLQVELEPSCGVAAAKMRALAEAGDPAGCLMLAQAYHDGLYGCDK
jgi:TPR repeat protein